MEDQERYKPNSKSGEQDFNGREGAQQHLGGDKGRSPNQYGYKGGIVASQGCLLFFHH